MLFGEVSENQLFFVTTAEGGAVASNTDYVVCCFFGSMRMKQRKVNYKVHNLLKETTFDQEKISIDNLDVGAANFKTLTEDWRQLSVKQSALEGLGEALKSFRQKNEKALADGIALGVGAAVQQECR
ncbi:hypothetical protein ACET3Z_032076 [Daucus carota]